MAVGSFLIPVANFWWPYLAVREIWKGSDPRLPPFRPEPFTTRRGSSLVALWWVAFLANNLFSWVVAEVAIYTRGDGFSGLRLTAELQIASRVLRLVSVALTAALAYRIMRRQDALRLQMTPAPAPPQRELAPAMGLPPAAV